MKKRSRGVSRDGEREREIDMDRERGEKRERERDGERDGKVGKLREIVTPSCLPKLTGTFICRYTSSI